MLSEIFSTAGTSNVFLKVFLDFNKSNVVLVEKMENFLLVNGVVVVSVDEIPSPQ